MLSGNNGILQRATDAKKQTERATIIETAKTDILGQIAENKGKGISKKELADILNRQFKTVDENTIPDEISNTSDIELTTIDKRYTINLTEIYIGTFAEDTENNKWVYDHATQTVTKGDLTFNIGDYIKYDAPESTSYTGNKKWRVLGEEDGKLLLVSTDLVCSEETKGQPYPMISLSGDSSGLDNAINELNRIGALYMDTDMADSGRSINLEDINKITGYNPEESYLDANNLAQTGQCFSGDINQYGNIVTYTIKDGVTNSGKRVWYRGKNISPLIDTETANTSFKLPGNTNDITETIEIQSTAFKYYAETLGNFEKSSVPVEFQGDLKGLDVNSSEYDVLFGKFGNSCPPYYLATTWAYTQTGIAYWGICGVNRGYVYGGSSDSDTSNLILWNSSSGATSKNHGVRSVICLKSDVVPELDTRT